MIIRHLRLQFVLLLEESGTDMSHCVCDKNSPDSAESTVENRRNSVHWVLVCSLPGCAIVGSLCVLLGELSPAHADYCATRLLPPADCSWLLQDGRSSVSLHPDFSSDWFSPLINEEETDLKLEKSQEGRLKILDRYGSEPRCS